MGSRRLAWIRFSSLSIQPSAPTPTPPVPAPRASALARALVPIKPLLLPTQTQEPTISQSPPPLPPTAPSSPPPPNIAPPRSPVASTTPPTITPSASPIAAPEPTPVAAPLRSSPSPPPPTPPLSTPTNVPFPIGKTNVKSSKTSSIDEVEFRIGQKNILAIDKSMKTHITGEYKGAVMELNKNNNSNKSIKFLNSNVQGVNNSILYNAICGHNDPGIHLSNNHE